MKNVIFHPLAEQELIDAVAYYEEQEPGLGLEYIGEIEHAVSFLIRYPEAGSKIQDSLRRLILPKFPYYLLYRILESDQIRILAVAHHKRKPQYWVERE
ncbi:MAG: type II toxin-antitoxin system RelE/ParE family toxin [Nostoc sp. NMS1]|uniref:type II toxin-antitoxin system RelE/ParE family toxin n=1 Tax=unclassified Nostoc TaxID=2593658 RepID=UPI0025F8B023|nr:MULTISPECIES: type II toxin-antitoxin system RelE/ParE family toxin [unclassified Nostoc]MBN3909005.1 type II toxin-antitoxin system RelE/ParE family toxin [Nostoc sp. NMS1]MBN3991414.1 type II toxin-antitoxin system RelE/ParE family toxin [Nostoc sp. NMS2]